MIHLLALNQPYCGAHDTHIPIKHPPDSSYTRPATKVGRKEEGNSHIGKLAEGTDQAEDNEAAQEQKTSGRELRKKLGNGLRAARGLVPCFIYR